MTVQTRYTFDGIEYGSVDRELKLWDYVVIFRDDLMYLRVVDQVSASYFGIDRFIDGRINFGYNETEYDIVEPLAPEKHPVEDPGECHADDLGKYPVEDPGEGYDYTVNLVYDNHFQNLIEDSADRFKHFLLDKNERYGDSVLQTYLTYGQVSFDVRLEDKKNRLKHLLETGGDIEDTVKDIHGYMMLNEAVKEYEESQ